VTVTPKTPKASGKGLRKRWKNFEDGTIYEWDYRHGRVEKYNSRGKHLGEFDYQSGVQIKDANPNRSIEP